MPGLTDAGYEAKTAEDITADLDSRAQSEFGPTIRTDAFSVMGHIIAIMTDGLLPVWELSQALYDAFSTDNARGQMLDNLAGVIGVVREPATTASGTVTLTGTDLTVVPSGSIVSAPTLNDATFVTLSDVTIGATVSGEVDVQVEAEEPGLLVVLATEVDTIITPVAGWSGVTNAADFADDGSDVESDSELRTRMVQSPQIVGAGTDNAIRPNVAALDDVDNALVISNRTLVTDVNGTPGKAFLTVIWPDTGVDEERVAETIFTYMPSGILPHGDVSYDVTDDQGVTQTVAFSYASTVNVGMSLELTVDASFPVDGADQVQTAVFNVLSSALDIGVDVLTLTILCAASTVEGIVSIDLKLDEKPPFPPAVSTSNITIGNTEIAIVAFADILVTVP